MNICQMCANRIPTGNGDNFKCNKKCDEYLEFVALPIYGAAPDMYEALKDLLESYDVLMELVLPANSVVAGAVKGAFINIDKARQALRKAEGGTD